MATFKNRLSWILEYFVSSIQRNIKIFECNIQQLKRYQKYLTIQNQNCVITSVKCHAFQSFYKEKKFHYSIYFLHLTTDVLHE